MSAIHDLIAQIADPRLRERLATEWANAAKNKKFGLVFEDHLPELLPLHGATPRKGDLVCRRQGALKDVWQVKSLNAGIATCIKPGNEAHPSEPTRAAVEPEQLPVDELMVVREFGEPIFPALVPVDAVANGPADAPWHTLIEADNYHALQLLDYLYAGQVDCIYIDPPYNTGARDWKYNNDYVDGNDGWRHSKWLAFMEKRLVLAKRLLNPDNSVLVVTIDEKEYLHLGMLLEKMFPDARTQMVTIVINAPGQTRKQQLARVEEYAYFLFLGSAEPPLVADDLLNEKPSHNPSTVRWESLLRSGTNSRRIDRPALFYPVYIHPESREMVGAGDS
jgi:adenine-specific DNA-methyltransferase